MTSAGRISLVVPALVLVGLCARPLCAAAVIARSGEAAMATGLEPVTFGSGELLQRISQVLSAQTVLPTSPSRTTSYGGFDFCEFCGLLPAVWVERSDFL